MSLSEIYTQIERIINDFGKFKHINDFDRLKPVDFSTLSKLDENYRYFLENGFHTNVFSEDKSNYFPVYKLLLQKKIRNKWSTLKAFYIPTSVKIKLPRGKTIYNDRFQDVNLRELFYPQGKHQLFIHIYSDIELYLEKNAQLKITFKDNLRDPIYIKEESEKALYIIDFEYNFLSKSIFLKIINVNKNVVFYYPKTENFKPNSHETISLEKFEKNQISLLSLKKPIQALNVYQSEVLEIPLSQYRHTLTLRFTRYDKETGMYEGYKANYQHRVFYAKEFYIVNFTPLIELEGRQLDIKVVDYIEDGLQWGKDYDLNEIEKKYGHLFVTRSSEMTFGNHHYFYKENEDWDDKHPIEPIRQSRDLQFSADAAHNDPPHDLSTLRLGLHGIKPRYSNKDYLGIYYRKKGHSEWKLYAFYKGVYDKQKESWTVHVLKPGQKAWTIDEIVLYLQKSSLLNKDADIVDLRSLPKLPDGYRYRLTSHETYLENRPYKSFAHSLVIEKNNSRNKWEEVKAFHYPIEKRVLIGSTPILVDPAYTETALDIECSGKNQKIILGYKRICWFNFNKKTKASFYFLKTPFMPLRYLVQGQNKEFIFDLSDHPFLAVVENTSSLQFFSDQGKRLTIKRNKTTLREVKHSFISDKVIKLSKAEFVFEHKNRIVVDYQELGLNLEKVEILKVDFVNEGVVWGRNNKGYDIGYSKKTSHSQLTHFYNQRDLLGLFYRKKGENASSSDWKLAALYEGYYQKGAKSGWVITEYRKQ